MISPMMKLTLAGLKRQKDEILDVLFRVGCVSLKQVAGSDIDNDYNEEMYKSFASKCNRLKENIDFIEENLKQLDKQYLPQKIKIHSKEFNIDTSLSTIDKNLQEIEDIRKDIAGMSLNRATITASIQNLSPFLDIDNPLNEFSSTQNVTILLGTFPEHNLPQLDEFLVDYKMTAYEILSPLSHAMAIYSYKNEASSVVKKISELGFVRLNNLLDMTAKEKTKELYDNLAILDKKEQEIKDKICEYKEILPLLKLAYDVNQVKSGKIEESKKILSTQSAFVLEAYLPKKSKDRLEQALLESCLFIEFEIKDVAKNESPPTLLENNKIVKPFEFITNMYSSPSYRELDPNSFIMFFFSLFFGFIMADIGYGIVMIILGLSIASRKNVSQGTASLMRVIAVSGVFTVVFGVLFGSFFALTHSSLYLIPISIMPSPAKDVIPLLCICLAGGMVQIMVSLFLKGLLLIRRGKAIDSIFNGFIWEFFFVGIFLIGLDYLGFLSNVTNIGLMLLVITIALAFIGNVFINKGINRLTKSFSSVYSVINIFSDILSYARIFGLMLSGNIIASIVTDLSSGLFVNLPLSILGVAVLLIGHAFNIVMGLLSGYIHVSRLQYVEFFSRFYEGEGELFSPFLRDLEYTIIID